MLEVLAGPDGIDGRQSGVAAGEYVAALELDPNHAFARAKVDLLTGQAAGQN